MRAVLLLAAAVLTACAPSARLSRGDGESIAAVRSLAADARPRIVVAAVVDRSGEDESVDAAVAALNARRSVETPLTSQALLASVRDLLITELFVSGRFVVLEREALDAVLVEQAFVAEAAELALPPATLEGADVLVLAAITAIDPGLDGGALPLPVPLGDDGIGLLHLRAARGYVALDLRVVDARSARVLDAATVEGRYWRLGADMSGYFDIGGDILELPGLARLYRNTPLEAALQRMSLAAVAHIAGVAER
ncbi:CsgG/HfaB family protein [Sinimarinibacterium flocculans]|uniref:CsgG/HfaB family protein n=1 Tax=Sinimarinibacterium flocculans TaxID=985250 RepID=UPI0024934F0A|nr:CsgG/HfaB family protein [Sinimarinibacterium flocculans]